MLGVKKRTRQQGERQMGQYIDESTGATADSVYITTIEGEEIASLHGHAWTDEMVERLEKEHGFIIATFEGGTLDGHSAI
jgi:hypothetical protein